MPIREHNSDGSSWIVNWEVRTEEKRRPFPDYPESIAHLTRVKLAIDEEDREWQSATPCKIVEGMYTKSGKEVITKTVRLNDECDRPSERHFSSGLPRQQRGISFPVQQAMAGSYDWSALRGSGTVVINSTATGMDVRFEPYTLSA